MEYLLQISNNTWGIILFSALMLAVGYGYIWLGKQRARQDYKEMNYPKAKRMTREQKEKMRAKQDVIDGKLYSDELFLGN